jgi:hypothetical protein
MGYDELKAQEYEVKNMKVGNATYKQVKNALKYMSGTWAIYRYGTETEIIRVDEIKRKENF